MKKISNAALYFAWGISICNLAFNHMSLGDYFITGICDIFLTIAVATNITDEVSE